MDPYKLILFNLTCVVDYKEDDEPLPNVKKWFEENPFVNVAFLSNQGGVGLRYWMESNEFGNPELYPTEHETRVRMNVVMQKLDISHRLPVIYLCFAYQSRKGHWSPVPPGQENNIEWSPRYRLPAPGMLIHAIHDFKATPKETLLVGNEIEDAQAANKAGCNFMEGYDFFAKGT